MIRRGGLPRPPALRPEMARVILGPMGNLISVLRARGVDKAFPLLDLDFVELFEKLQTGANAHAYDQHEWIIGSDPGLGSIVNAVPCRDMLEELAWEEWFRKDGKTRHHVLSLKRPARWDDVFVAPEHDEVHPEVTFGRTWYVIEDPDMRPLLLRGRWRV